MTSFVFEPGGTRRLDFLSIWPAPKTPRRRVLGEKRALASGRVDTDVSPPPREASHAVDARVASHGPGSAANRMAQLAFRLDPKQL